MYGGFDYSLTRKLLVAVSDQWDSHVLSIDKVAPPNWKVYYIILVFEFKFFKYFLHNFCRLHRQSLFCHKWKVYRCQCFTSYTFYMIIQVIYLFIYFACLAMLYPFCFFSFLPLACFLRASSIIDVYGDACFSMISKGEKEKYQGV